MHKKMPESIYNIDKDMNTLDILVKRTEIQFWTFLKSKNCTNKDNLYATAIQLFTLVVFDPMISIAVDTLQRSECLKKNCISFDTTLISKPFFWAVTSEPH